MLVFTLRTIYQRKNFKLKSNHLDQSLMTCLFHFSVMLIETRSSINLALNLEYACKLLLYIMC